MVNQTPGSALGVLPMTSEGEALDMAAGDLVAKNSRSNHPNESMYMTF